MSLLVYVELFLQCAVRELRTASRLHGRRLLHGYACHRGVVLQIHAFGPKLRVQSFCCSSVK
jgi:hypothetical protein